MDGFGSAKIKVIHIGPQDCEVCEAKRIDQCAAPGDGRITWLHFHGAYDTAALKQVAEMYKLHPLTVEQILDMSGRPRLNESENYVLIEMETFIGTPSMDELQQNTRQISIVLGRDFLISFQEGDEDIFASVRERIKGERDIFFRIGAGYVAYCLIDLVMENYFEVLEKIDEEMFDLEEQTTLRHDDETLRRIQCLRRNTMLVRRAAWPLREVIGGVQRRGAALISTPAGIYFSEIYNHAVQVIDTTETFREVLSNIFDIYLSSINNKMNEIMKVLTIIATVILPMTLVTGLYGMNFKFMPELRWRYGYPMALGIMAAIAVTLLSYFKKRKWF